MTKLRVYGVSNSSYLQAGKTARVGERMRWKRLCAAFVLCAATAIAAPAQTFTTLFSFDCTDGCGPVAGLIQATDGNLYGTTYYGGSGSYGTIFKITPSGTLTTLFSFDDTDGSEPLGLIQATDGNFYGTTRIGTTTGGGTVFKITPDGTLTTLYTFCSVVKNGLCQDGAYPAGGLVQATNGDLYGTTSEGGVNATNQGTVFKITTSGTLTTLHSFCALSGCTDGGDPTAGLIQATNGDLYGTTDYGAYGLGTVFKMTPSGKLTIVHSFDGTDGDTPSGLVQDTNGDFYGTTYYGGASGNCAGFCGTVFKMTPGGTLTTLHSFDGTDGYYPVDFGGLVQATDGNLYGTTLAGGANQDKSQSPTGTVFKITPGGTLTTLYNFCSATDCEDGMSPYAGLVQHTNGKLYGTTYAGIGGNSNGTIYSLSVGLGPFVKTLPTNGIEGATISILGQGFTSSSTVEFGGVQATSVSLNGSADLIVDVPAGALTGEVTVTTSGQTLKSNQTFRVIPQITSFSPDSGPVGQSVTITGTGLTQTTAVTFGGVKASAFTVDSDTQVTATVPTGAKTGKIKITTKGGTATSASSFTVT
jgi:uncharacterized repeat protein (TIGR03803 family)